MIIVRILSLIALVSLNAAGFASNLEKIEPYNAIAALTKSLSETADLKEATAASGTLFDVLKDQADFSLLVAASSDQTDQVAQLIPALIRIEKFRLTDIKRARYATPLDYYMQGAKNKTSQAVLLSLVTAIQKSLENPKATARKLLELVTYQKNCYVLESIKPDIENLFLSGFLSRLITEDLIKQIQATSLTIFDVQKKDIEEEANRQKLLAYSLPIFDQQEGTQEIKSLSLRYFGSSGAGLACGFFSLGFAGREQAIRQIIDNLVEKNIYILADKVSGTSSDLKAAMGRHLSKKETLPPRLLDLYAKKHHRNRQDEKLLENLTAEYATLLEQVTKAEAAIDDEFEALKKEKGLPVKVPKEDDGTIAVAIQLLRKPFEHRKWAEQARITQFFYHLDDFQQHIQKNIHEKFASGMLEFDPNPDWKLGTPTYPDIIAVLNHCDIYAWVSPHAFKCMQASASATVPLYETPDKVFILTNFISGGKDARRIDIINMSGGHFEKWVNAEDFCGLSRALHHKKEYGLFNTK